MEEKKTVAERLRNIAAKEDGCMPIADLAEGHCYDFSCTECANKALNNIADMIEAEQAELHHDVDVDVDTLLKLANSIEYEAQRKTGVSIIPAAQLSLWVGYIRDAVKGATFEQAKPQLPEGIEWPRFEDGEPVSIFDEVQHFGPVYKISFTELGYDLHSGDWGLHASYGTPVKRPEPEVLDADGVPIKVGDTVYVVGGGVPEDVRKIQLRQGCGTYEVLTDYIEDGDMGYLPEKLTHRKPDTQEAIEDDATMPPIDYCNRYQLLGADGAYFDEAEAIEAMCRHLIHRTRKLMGGEQA